MFALVVLDWKAGQVHVLLLRWYVIFTHWLYSALWAFLSYKYMYIFVYPCGPRTGEWACFLHSVLVAKFRHKWGGRVGRGKNTFAGMVLSYILSSIIISTKLYKYEYDHFWRSPINGIWNMERGRGRGFPQFQTNNFALKMWGTDSPSLVSAVYVIATWLQNCCNMCQF